MFSVLLETLVPLISLFIFVLGNGFFSTLLAYNMTLNGEPALYIGAMTGVMYAGLVIGSFHIERFITRVGHIRAYSTFSASIAVITLLHGMYYSFSFWLALRFVYGFATAGIYVVIESWLLCKSTPVNRGQVLSFYMVCFYLAQAFGQFFLNLGNTQDLFIYAIVSMLTSLSIIPLAMSYVRTPQIEAPSTLSFRELIKQASSGLIGCFSSGLILSAIYALMPTYLNELSFAKHDVAKYMFAIIIGGMLLQYPVGKISDLVERRLVLIGIAIATIFICVAINLHIQISWLLFTCMMLFGGLTFTIYPISISHACDSLAQEDIVAGTQSLLLSYSIGAMLGPFIAPLFMQTMGPNGLFIYMSVVCLLMIPVFVYRKVTIARPKPEETFQSTMQTTPVMAEIDPRGDVNSEAYPEEDNNRPQVWEV
ncbi:MFS transporter [Legionella sp. W05-934-2]|uniref:MFS transporter n=1 Tax=Legionella sp. W05-934-2 TaxID=1198649 RepID=UPI003462B346